MFTVSETEPSVGVEVGGYRCVLRRLDCTVLRRLDWRTRGISVGSCGTQRFVIQAEQLRVLAPRNGYLPLLADSIEPHFQSTLPPGSDTIWFEYQSLPLKWHIPTGVLFDLLCAEPERPWNLTVHFRAYPSEVLSACEDEDSVKWNFVNALKEASYVMYGNIKSVMNLSQVEQAELWKSVVKGDLENYDHIFGRLKPGLHFNTSAPWNLGRTTSHRPASAESVTEAKTTGRAAGSEGARPMRLPMRFYVRLVKENSDDFDDCPPVGSWDQLIYMTRPIDIPKDKDTVLTLRDALLKVVPYLFSSPASSARTQADGSGASNRDSIRSDPVKVKEDSDEGSEHEKVESTSGELVEGVAPTPSSGVETTESPESSPSKDIENQESRLNEQAAGDERSTQSSVEEGSTPQESDRGLSQGVYAESMKQFQGIIRVQELFEGTTHYDVVAILRHDDEEVAWLQCDATYLVSYEERKQGI